MRGRPVRGLLVASLVMASVVVAPAASADPVTAGGGYSARISRTAYGVPHIRAATIGSAGYGYGFAFAQDNVCSLEQAVLTAEGARSRYYGATADSGEGNVTNLDSDVYHRSLNDSGVLDTLLARPAPLGPSRAVRELVAGYAAGVNRYLKDTGARGTSCEGEPWLRPVTELDLYRIMYNLTQTGGLDSAKTAIATARPAVAQTLSLPGEDGSGMGSNGIAAGRTGTADGHGEVLANPHFPWLGGRRFYQVQLTVPGVLDVSGASLYGTPTVEIGHTRDLAWTHTVSTAQRYTLYELRLVPGDPTSYLVDGVAERMTERTVTVPVKGQEAVARTLYSSRYGPVLAGNWSATSALAMKGANATNLRALDEWLDMGRAGSVPELRAAQDEHQGIPFVNTIAADSAGRTYLADAGVVPHVTDDLARQCVTTAIGKALYPAQTVLDGSASACAWGSDPDAIEPGILGPAALPSLERTDYVTNSNDSLWLTNPAEPVTGYPRIVGDVSTARTLRTRLGLTMLDRAAGGISTEFLKQTVFSGRNYSAELARDATTALCRANSRLTATDGETVDVSGACAVLAAWNLRADPDSRGAALWRQFWANARRAPDLWTVPFDPDDPVNTPRGLNTSSAVVRTALADATQRFGKLGLDLAVPLSAVQVTTVGGETRAVPGCSHEEGCYDVVTNATRSGLLGDDGRFPEVTYGTSFVMAVDLGPSGPKGWTLTTYSQSADPTSPHHGDQTRLFSRKQMVRERFTESEIAADPALEVTWVRS